MPIVVFEPYLEGTQDEKQFRVMKDRERWFNVVMGERLELDEASTDRQELRAPFPSEAADVLAMDLSLAQVGASTAPRFDPPLPPKAQ